MSQVLNSNSNLRVLRLTGLFALLAVIMGGSLSANAQAINEDFASLATMFTQGWSTVNHSAPVNGAIPGWQQCAGTRIQPAHSGAPLSCAQADFNGGTGTATMNMWLIGPNRTFNNGDTLTFYTRSQTNNFPDRMQVRLSQNGTSTNVGTGADDVGDFTDLLLDIDPLYEGIYPITWTQFEITLSGLPAGGVSGRFSFRYYVEDSGPDGNNGIAIGIDTLVYTPNAAPSNSQHVVDFNGDGKTDFSVVRNTGGGPTGQVTWYSKLNGGAESQTDWGVATDFFVPEDYDGDDKTDIAVWRPGAAGSAAFYVLRSSNGTVQAVNFGQSGDDPTVVGDYTGDGLADLAIYRAGASSGDQSTWWYLASSGPNAGNQVPVPWGKNGDFPAPGDYDGDGKNDFAVQRNDGGGEARFYFLLATGAIPNTVRFGTPTDVILPGDYDGDGKTDIATIRGSGGKILWFMLPSSGGPYTTTIFGNSATDFPVQGDYDGDGKTDRAIWRPNADPTQNYFWYDGSTSGATPVEWGQNGDYPPANFNSH